MTSVHIAFPLFEGPTGGGNQFLKALREQFRSWNVYCETPDGADVLLFNSHHFGSLPTAVGRAFRMKRHDVGGPAVVHRVDGPITVVRGNARDYSLDRSIAIFNEQLSDATVFQSEWSRNVCHAYGVGLGRPSATIPNAPDPGLFFPSEPARTRHGEDRRCQIVASSWSANWRKGFDIYRFLDQDLDFSRFRLTFIGNSPIEFSNIEVLAPMCSRELGERLRRADMYLAASVDDPCSNALTEALHCGLPAVGRRSGGHPELIGDGGICFDGRWDVIPAIEKCAIELDRYRRRIRSASMEEIARRYLDFLQEVCAGYHADREMRRSGSGASVAIAAVRQRYGAGITRRLSRHLSIREDRFYRRIAPFRRAPWEPLDHGEWTERIAREWVAHVLDRLPLFMDCMRHRRDGTLYRYAYSGDLQEAPALAASTLAAKTRSLAGLLDDDERQRLAEHILSYRHADGTFADPWVARRGRWRRALAAIRLRGPDDAGYPRMVRAETREALEALQCLDVPVECASLGVPVAGEDLDRRVARLDWSRPSLAGAELAYLVSVGVQHTAGTGPDTDSSVTDWLRDVDLQYRRADGSWHAPGSHVSLRERLGGALEMIAALEAAGIREFARPDRVIDLCLAAPRDRHAGEYAGTLLVLHRCAGLTDHRHAEVRAFCLGRLRCARRYYWPWQGGFSYHPTGARALRHAARVSDGMAEPDLDGTALMTRSLAAVVELLGWQNDFNLARPLQ